MTLKESNGSFMFDFKYICRCEPSISACFQKLRGSGTTGNHEGHMAVLPLEAVLHNIHLNVKEAVWFGGGDENSV